MNIVNRIVLNATAGWIAKIVTVVTAIFLVPLLLSTLGKYDYGLWLSIGQGVGFFALLDLGIANGVCRFISKADALDDFDEQNGIFSVSMLIFWVAALVTIVAVFATASFIPHLLKLDSGKYHVARLIYILLGCRIAITFPLRVGRGLLQSKHRYDYIEYVSLFANLGQFLLIVLLCKYTAMNLYILCVVTVVIAVGMEWLLFVKARALCPDVRYEWHSVNKDRFKRVFSMGASSLVQTLAGMLHQRGQVLAVGVIMGMSLTPIFAIPHALLTRIGGMIGRVGATFMPIASCADARNEVDKLVKLSIYGTRYGLMLGLSVGGYLLFYGRDLITLWLSASVMTEVDISKIYWAMIIMVFPMVLSRANMGNRTILRATGDHWLVSNCLIVFSVVSLVIGISLMKYTALGVLGAAIGWSSRALILEGMLYPVFVYRKYKVSGAWYFRMAYLPSLTAFLMMIVVQLVFVRFISCGLVMKLVLGTLLYVLTALVCVLSICVDKNHRKRAVKYLLRKAEPVLGARNIQRLSVFLCNMVVFLNRSLRSVRGGGARGRKESSLSAHSFKERDSQVFFGYYDVSPFSGDDSRLLAMHAPRKNIVPVSGMVKLGYYDLNDYKRAFVEFGETETWCWQQGCRLQWYPFGGSEEVLYNKVVNARYGCVVQDVGSGKVLREYERPLYSVSRDGALGLSLNFSRLQRLRPGYGYVNFSDETAGCLAPEDDGVWRIDMKTGDEQMLISIAEIVRFESLESMEGAEHYFNHILFNPAGTRFLFMHLWVKDGKRFSRLITCDIDGGGRYALVNEGHASHCNWKSNDELIVFSTHADTGMKYYLYKDQSREREVAGEGVLVEDGHPSFSQDGRCLLTDTYPDKYGERHLLLYELGAGALNDIGSFLNPAGFCGEVRCDLHPRWSVSGRFISIDSAHKGKRCQYVFDFADLRDQG